MVPEAWLLESPTSPSKWKVPAPVFVRAQPTGPDPAAEEVPSDATLSLLSEDVDIDPLVSELFIENDRSLNNCAAEIIWLADKRFERVMSTVPFGFVVKLADALTVWPLPPGSRDPVGVE